MDLSNIQTGILALLASIIAGLLGWRGGNKVANDNARTNRESRFEENIQKRYDAAVLRNDELQEQLAIARDGRALLERQLRERDRRIKNLLELMTPQDRHAVERWVAETGFQMPEEFAEAPPPPPRLPPRSKP